MKKNRLKQLLIIVCLMAATCLAMAYSGKLRITDVIKPQMRPTPQEVVNLSGKLSQDKIYSGSDGIVSLELTLKADDIIGIKDDLQQDAYRHVDMVIVLDRSGSMSGQKIEDAKKAILNLVESLSPSDRFALVAYSDGAARLSDLTTVTPLTRKNLTAIIHNLSIGGGTNLGLGLTEGMKLLMAHKASDNLGRLILISDGLANQGITNQVELGNMASIAAEKSFSISTVGVGSDFNEQLMTIIADRGTGNYHYLEDPSRFASVFQEEFQVTRSVAASSVKIMMAEKNGIQLIDAGGFPINRKNKQAFFYPGDLTSGETRKIYLNLKIPTNHEMNHILSGIEVHYRHHDASMKSKLTSPLTIACVKDPKEAMASIDKAVWSDKVIQEDFSRLREEVAEEIRIGNKKEAEEKINTFYSDKNEINAHVQSEAVAQNLNRDLEQLRQTVNDTFSGDRQEVAVKQKKTAKKLQYEGYRDRRMKNPTTKK